MEPRLARALSIASVVVAAASVFVHMQAQAQTSAFPTKPVRIVVPFSAGSVPDVIARTLSQSMSDSGFGQQVVVENRAGAGGTIGSELVAKAPADAYTLLLGSTATLGIAPSLYPNLSYRPDRDFAPVIRAATVPVFVVVTPSLGVSSIRGLIDLVKAKPGQLSFGSAGNGTPLHIAGEMFKSATGADIVHVPYAETGVMNNDFISGRIQIMFQQLPTLVQHIRAGKLKPLAVAAAKRDSRLPEVPTTSESGLPGYEVSSWFGVVAPRGSPAEAIDRLNVEMNKALAQGPLRDSLIKLGFDPSGGTPAEFGAFIAAEIAKWSSAVKASRAKLD
jgi:tripartite-type tricarboxylate transporter receptor subunit TctC